MRILFCGSRTWRDEDTVRAWMQAIPTGCTVVCPHGGISGSWQEIIVRLAAEQRLAVEIVAPIRAAYGCKIVMAFHGWIANSIETLQIVGQAVAAGIPVALVEHTDDGALARWIDYEPLLPEHAIDRLARDGA